MRKLINSFYSLARSAQKRATRSSLGIIKASSKIIPELIFRGVRELVSEIALFGVGFGLTIIFHSWGASNSLALGLSIVIVILSCILSIRFFSHRKSKLDIKRTLKTTRTKVKGEEKFANSIAQILAQKAPKEWEEYQDWLHDILLDRLQLLDRGLPVWKVRLITYWRLIGFCFIVGLIKLRRLAIRLRA